MFWTDNVASVQATPKALASEYIGHAQHVAMDLVASTASWKTPNAQPAHFWLSVYCNRDGTALRVGFVSVPRPQPEADLGWRVLGRWGGGKEQTSRGGGSCSGPTASNVTYHTPIKAFKLMP
jgi:hypothetical protein